MIEIACQLFVLWRRYIISWWSLDTFGIKKNKLSVFSIDNLSTRRTVAVRIVHSVNWFVQFQMRKNITDIYVFTHVSDGGGAGGAAAPSDVGGSEGAARQRRRAALLPAPPDF